MPLVTVTIEIEEFIYNEAKAVLNNLGYTLEDALTLYLKAVVYYGQIPFDYSKTESEWEMYLQEQQ